MKLRRIIDSLTLEEKIALVSGADQWHLVTIPRLQIPQIAVADGPHGLRKKEPEEEPFQMGGGVPATCFPAAAALANSWDVDLLSAVGRAVGEECLKEGVSVLLGPGINIKRSPLGGRNFEYFSEDPFLAGELAAAWIRGLQSVGVGASLKYLAANNREKRRMSSDSQVDERALREIYLSAFEKAVQKGKPWTVVASSNKLNGTYCSEHEGLLNSILRKEWGFQGLVLSDWGAVHDRVAGIKAGLDLEMPASFGLGAAKIEHDLSTGRLTEVVLDKSVRRVLELIYRGEENKQADYKYDQQEHHALAKKAALQSAVLLKNEGDLLPLKENSQQIGIIGELAKKPRYQGGGVSWVNPTRLTTIYQEFTEAQIDFSFARGYALGDQRPNEGLIAEACHVAEEVDLVLVCAGLPAGWEWEGCDRSHLDLPPAHNELIRRVAEVNKRVVVILSGGAPVTMPWLGQVQAVLHTYLGGQAAASAVLDLLFGKENPSGKLAESYPLALEDTPANQYFDRDGSAVQYRESIYVGYRYYDTAGKDVLFPFGYGLSYTQFHYEDLRLSSKNLVDTEELIVSFMLKNVGPKAGADIVQLYLSKKESPLFRTEQELQGFKKVFLEPGQETKVEFTLNKRSFAYFNAEIKDWHVEGGRYEIRLGASSRDIRLKESVYVQSSQPEVPVPDYRERAPAYYNLAQGPVLIPDQDFWAIYGGPLPPPSSPGLFDLNSTLEDLQTTRIGRFLQEMVKKRLKSTLKLEDEEDPRYFLAWSRVFETPFRSLQALSGGAVPQHLLLGVLAWANGRPLKALKLWLQR